jgi:DNA-binding NarL/FixJ family response regulator/tetratricopeptide (TPR) repeat protein
VRERRLLRWLSVFAGGFALEDVEAVCAGADAERGEVLELVGALVDKSLIDTERREDEVRYRLLETIRQYAAEQLAQAGERELLLDRHARHFAAVAAQADRLRLDPDGRRRLAVEEPNFRVALDHAVERDPATALAIAAGLSRWWLERDHYREGRARCARALAAAEPGQYLALRSIVHWGAGMLALYQSDFPVVAESITLAIETAEQAGDPRALGRAHMLASAAFACLAPVEGVRHGTRAVELLRELGDPIELAWALASLATAHGASDDYPAAHAAAEECIALAEAGSDAAIAAWAQWILGVVLALEGELAASVRRHQRAIELIAGSAPVLQALALGCRLIADALSGAAAGVCAEGQAGLERALATAALGEAALRPGLCMVHLARGELEQATRVGEPGTSSGILYFEGNTHTVLARVALACGDLDGARAHAKELERLAAATGNRRFHAQAAYALGRAALLAGDLPHARERLHHALAAQLQLGARVHAIESLEALAAAAAEAEAWPAAARLLAAAARERQRLGAPRLAPDAQWLERVREAALDALGERSLAEASDQGAALSFADAAAYAQRSRGPRERPPDGWDALTPTEQQVARLAAEGLTNAQIAQQLFVSRSTTKLHLSRAYRKLAVANRTELARSAREATHPD